MHVFCTKKSLCYGKTGTFYGLLGFVFTLQRETLDGKGVESRWTLYFITFSSYPYVWWHISYQSSILPCIFFVQDGCEQADNISHLLGFCSKKCPKAGVTSSIWVVGGLAEKRAAQQQLRGWWPASGGGLWPPPSAPCSFVCQARCQGKQGGIFPSPRRSEQVKKGRAIQESGTNCYISVSHVKNLCPRWVLTPVVC